MELLRQLLAEAPLKFDARKIDIDDEETLDIFGERLLDIASVESRLKKGILVFPGGIKLPLDDLLKSELIGTIIEDNPKFNLKVYFVKELNRTVTTTDAQLKEGALAAKMSKRKTTRDKVVQQFKAIMKDFKFGAF